MIKLNEGLLEDLTYLFGLAKAEPTYSRLLRIVATFQRQLLTQDHSSLADRFTEKDSVLITYGDMVRRQGELPLKTLDDFLAKHLTNTVSTVHILPFFPYSSDDGFSVIDYYAVDPNLGTWAYVSSIGDKFRLMFDAVINHISAESDWFQGFLDNEPAYQEYFTVMEPDSDLSLVFRPRTMPLLTPVFRKAANKVKDETYVWTTFGADQIDVNYPSPDLLLDILAVLLFYVANGAEFIRLDAIAFIWKEVGTSCIHLPQTHRIIQLMRKVLDLVSPQVAIITETNVPHEENISYFGDGSNEAQLVYNFSLPPLTLHTFHTGNVEALCRWASSLKLPSDQVTFFNFLASHDGIGLTPVRGYLSEHDINEMARRTEGLGGHVSFRSNPDGSMSPYELNIGFLDALGDPTTSGEKNSLIARRFLGSQAIMLALRGVPGIYFHSLFGSRSWFEGVEQSGRARTINRQKLERDDLERELADPDSLRHEIFSGYNRMLEQRCQSKAFHPRGEQQIFLNHEAVFCLLRISPDGHEKVLCLQNVTTENHRVSFYARELNGGVGGSWKDLLSGIEIRSAKGDLAVDMGPYQTLWLTPV
jgi:sucrose phosphorylase